jgi:hypothetical protein
MSANTIAVSIDVSRIRWRSFSIVGMIVRIRRSRRSTLTSMDIKIRMVVSMDRMGRLKRGGEGEKVWPCRPVKGTER